MSRSVDVTSGAARDASAWQELGTALVSDCLSRFQAMHGRMRLLAGESLCGPAFTVQTVAGENGTIHRALASAPRGAILVVDAGGYVDRAVWGEVLTAAAQNAGLGGAVIDGATRDVAAIRARGFPLVAAGVCPAGPHKGWEGHVGAPVQCGGVVVSPGDLVCADEDGVVVVPAGREAEVLAAARARAEMEREWLRRIDAGESSADVLGLSAG